MKPLTHHALITYFLIFLWFPVQVWPSSHLAPISEIKRDGKEEGEVAVSPSLERHESQVMRVAGNNLGGDLTLDDPFADWAKMTDDLPPSQPASKLHRAFSQSDLKPLFEEWEKMQDHFLSVIMGVQSIQNTFEEKTKNNTENSREYKRELEVKNRNINNLDKSCADVFKTLHSFFPDPKLKSEKPHDEMVTFYGSNFFHLLMTAEINGMIQILDDWTRYLSELYPPETVQMAEAVLGKTRFNLEKHSLESSQGLSYRARLPSFGDGDINTLIENLTPNERDLSFPSEVSTVLEALPEGDHTLNAEEDDPVITIGYLEPRKSSWSQVSPASLSPIKPISVKKEKMEVEEEEDPVITIDYPASSRPQPEASRLSPQAPEEKKEEGHEEYPVISSSDATPEEADTWLSAQDSSSQRLALMGKPPYWLFVAGGVFLVSQPLSKDPSKPQDSNSNGRQNSSQLNSLNPDPLSVPVAPSPLLDEYNSLLLEKGFRLELPPGVRMKVTGVANPDSFPLTDVAFQHLGSVFAKELIFRRKNNGKEVLVPHFEGMSTEAPYLELNLYHPVNATLRSAEKVALNYLISAKYSSHVSLQDKTWKIALPLPNPLHLASIRARHAILSKHMLWEKIRILWSSQQMRRALADRNLLAVRALAFNIQFALGHLNEQEQFKRSVFWEGLSASVAPLTSVPYLESVLRHPQPSEELSRRINPIVQAA